MLFPTQYGVGVVAVFTVVAAGVEGVVCLIGGFVVVTGGLEIFVVVGSL